MPEGKHPLEIEYGLTKEELLNALGKRFRAKVTLEGAVAEVHLGKQIRQLQRKHLIERFEEHDRDGYPDYTIWLPSKSAKGFTVECKNIRDAEEAYREGGAIVAYKVETQKTRASQGDDSSRFYGFDQFDILAVCLGKKTHNWKEFMLIRSKDLQPHPGFKSKIAVMHRVPLPGSDIEPPWYSSLENLIKSLNK